MVALMRRPSFLARFNPRLHPFVAAGIGLGLVALFVPAPARLEERHSHQEILARLTLPLPDLDHGPAFWLAEIQEGTELAVEARERCRALESSPSPTCELLTSLEQLVRLLAPTPADLHAERAGGATELPEAEPAVDPGGLEETP